MEKININGKDYTLEMITTNRSCMLEVKNAFDSNNINLGEIFELLAIEEKNENKNYESLARNFFGIYMNSIKNISTEYLIKLVIKYPSSESIAGISKIIYERHPKEEAEIYIKQLIDLISITNTTNNCAFSFYREVGDYLSEEIKGYFLERTARSLNVLKLVSVSDYWGNSGYYSKLPVEKHLATIYASIKEYFNALMASQDIEEIKKNARKIDELKHMSQRRPEFLEIHKKIMHYIFNTGNLNLILFFQDNAAMSMLDYRKEFMLSIISSNELKLMDQIKDWNDIVDVIEEFINAVIGTNIPEYIYLIAHDSKMDAEYKDKLIAALIRLNNPKFIGYTSLYIDGISEEMEKILANAVKNLGDYSWARKPNPELHKELREKLLNSDDSIENPFAPVNDEKRMKLEENA